MEELLKQILDEMRMQTLYLKKLTLLNAAQETNLAEARESMRRAADAFKGTPFGPIMDKLSKGGG
jgi:hypothetical protein